MGVWIEIALIKSIKISSIVTPYVGVWIEISHSLCRMRVITVTPYVGVWIEIVLLHPSAELVIGHPLCWGVD